MGETYASRNSRANGGQPSRRDMPEKADPKTEGVRETLKGNPFAKRYAGKDFGE